MSERFQNDVIPIETATGCQRRNPVIREEGAGAPASD